jgi:ribonucleoside-diphosphate reductase alpha chain
VGEVPNESDSVSAISQIIWEAKYRYSPEGQAVDTCIEDTWRRVATAVAAAESVPSQWEPQFFEILADLRFLPGGRILAGAGTQRQVTLYNCFVAGTLQDSMDGILNALRETAITLQQGGGVGCDFSPLRPAGTSATRAGTVASGPVSFLRVWNTLGETMLSTSSRRGAMMATLRCDHPDIEAFVAAKLEPGELSHFNLSVLVTDAFMDAVEAGSSWVLRYPAASPSASACAGASVHREIDARDLWRQIATAAHRSGEPGVLFIDRINRENNLHYCERITSTNPCGEVPLPPFGACNLGSINLPALVVDPFTARARLDEQALLETAAIAVRFLDDVTDVSRFPIPQQQEQARATRRIGLGVTGLADMLVMLGLHYGSDRARQAAEQTLRLIRDCAYRTSTQLAVEKGVFPRFDVNSVLASPFIQRLGLDIQARIARHGLRNSHLLAIAPAGSISLLADNVSSGIEPIFALSANRTIRGKDLQLHEYVVQDHAYRLWLQAGGKPAEVPDEFVTAEQLPVQAHLEMQACLQPLVDGAISKTINLPPEATVLDVQELFSRAYAKGLKGCTVFRRGCLTGHVLQAHNESQCCPSEGPGP